MAIVPTQRLPRTFRPLPVVSIEQYANYIEVNECNILGVSNAPNADNFECRDVWTLQQRQYIEKYLSEAQEEIENELKYFVVPDWTVGDISSERDHNFRYVDQQKPFANNNKSFRGGWAKNFGVFRARWKHLISPGTRAVTNIELGAVVNHATDPAVVTVTTTVTDVNEIAIYHPNSNIPINPSEIIISGGTATISIPRCRLVRESLLDNSPSGVNYEVVANFEETLDIKRIFTDTTTQATLICDTCGSCESTDVSGCLRVLNQRMGTIEFNTSNLSCVCGCVPSRIGFNYYSGNLGNNEKIKEMVVRLATSKMPTEPCGCEIAQRLWREDREVPEVVTKEMIDNPFGLNHGAIVVHQWIKAMPKMFSFGEM